ncbi:SKG1 [Candida theae]|uniref:SKG1 n=1 Tax=Candida theae TaxID=1198502 RepID=A0AAD5G115_9ASCO|nr:SKG1 [Candida theae]KAI5968068.1 SKG1 [Candida theae]
MVYSVGLAVGLSIGVPSFIILVAGFLLWLRYQRRLRKEDLDEDYLDKEIQNDDSSFRQFQEQLHKQRDVKPRDKKDDDGLQLKEEVVPVHGTSDSSNGSLESELHQSYELAEVQPQPDVSKPSKHPYGQHLHYPSSTSHQHQPKSQSSTSLSQASEELPHVHDPHHSDSQNMPSRRAVQQSQRRKGAAPLPPPPPPPHRQSSNKTQASVYTFYDTFIPTFGTPEPASQSQQNKSSSLPNSTHNSFSDLLNQTAHSSLNLLKSGHKDSANNDNAATATTATTTNNNNNTNNTNNTNQHSHTNSASNSNTSLLHSDNNNNNGNTSTSHSRVPSTDLDALAKQLNSPQFFEKLPSKAAAAQGKVYIKPRVPTSSSKPHNNSSSELINNYLVGENTALNDHFNYVAPMVETADSTDKLAQVQVPAPASGDGRGNTLTYNQYLSAKAATVDPSLRRPSQSKEDEQDQAEAIQEANPLNGQIGNAFDANISMEPTAMNKKNTTTNEDEDVMPPVVFQ